MGDEIFWTTDSMNELRLLLLLMLLLFIVSVIRLDEAMTVIRLRLLKWDYTRVCADVCGQDR